MAGVEVPLEEAFTEIQVVAVVCLGDIVLGLVLLKVCLLNPLHQPESNTRPHSPP